MDDKKKILLGSKDFIANGLNDIFINVNLQQTFNQIKKDKYDNNFDLAEQFRKERNNSRNFRVYGIIDSNVINTDSYLIEIYKDSNLTQLYSTIYTTPLIYEEKNIFNKKRGKYLLELDNYDADSVYIKINGDNVTYGDQSFEQKLVYYTLDGDFVEYGTETVDIGLNNSGFLSIENNFPFFYNKHWIKKDIEILETKKAIVNFLTTETSVNEGEFAEITIGLDKPSPFGNETLDLDIELVTSKLSDFSVSLSGSPVTFPKNLSWVIGEQNKTFEFTGINDDFPEFTESLSINMSNFQFIDSGITTTHLVNINDTTPRNYANYNFGEIYRNRYNFTGRTYYSNNNPIQTNTFSVLRNGLKFKKSSEEFYPNDTYKISIFNNGGDTIIPENQSIGTSSEELFLSNETKTFNISTKYTGTQVQKLKIILSGCGDFTSASNVGDAFINGVRFDLDLGINYVTLKQAFTTSNPLSIKNLETPWNFEFDDIKKEITIISKNPGVPIELSFVAAAGPGGFPFTQPVDNSKMPVIKEIDAFILQEQIPLVIKLAANSNNNTKCSYDITLSKVGFHDLYIQSTFIPSSIVPTNNFLITGIKNVMRTWDDNLQECTYNSSTTVPANTATSFTFNPFNQNPNQSNFIMPIGDAYINGFAFINNNTLYGHRSNETVYFSAEFFPSKLAIKPCTNDAILNNNINQKVKLTIPKIISATPTMRQLLVDNADSYRSFDFRTGTTGSFTKFSLSNPNFLQTFDIAWNKNINLAGGDFAVNSNGILGKVLDYGQPSTSIPVGPVTGLDLNNNQLATNSNLSTFYLESKVAGVPFEIANIVNAYVLTTASNNIGEQVVAGDILGPIIVEEIIPNGIAGQDTNPVKNWMGGFNPLLELEPILPPPPNPILQSSAL